ncbi:MAG: class I SAM-dependent methyltransferase [Dehalococcoidia bacterium]
MIYVDPQPEPGEIDPTTDHHHRLYYSLPAALRLAWVRRFAEGGRLLEVGCGEGEFVALAKASGFEVTGIEPHPGRAAVTRERHGIAVEEGLIETTALPAGAFDVVFHVDLLSHFPDPVDALRKMSERLRPGGVVCFEVGLFGGLNPRWYALAGRPHFPRHRWFFDEASLGAMLQRAGLGIVARRRYNLAPSTAMSSALARLLAPRKEERPSGRHGTPLARGSLGRAYYGLHHALRYGLGRWLPAAGPATALVTATHVGS